MKTWRRQHLAHTPLVSGCLLALAHLCVCVFGSLTPPSSSCSPSPPLIVLTPPHPPPQHTPLPPSLPPSLSFFCFCVWKVFDRNKASVILSLCAVYMLHTQVRVCVHLHVYPYVCDIIHVYRRHSQYTLQAGGGGSSRGLHSSNGHTQKAHGKEEGQSRLEA